MNRCKAWPAQRKNQGQRYAPYWEDMQKIDYKLANCCNPIPGDDVFGFITVSDGIKIHRTNCPNATKLMSQLRLPHSKSQVDQPAGTGIFNRAKDYRY